MIFYKIKIFISIKEFYRNQRNMLIHLIQTQSLNQDQIKNYFQSNPFFVELIHFVILFQLLFFSMFFVVIIIVLFGQVFTTPECQEYVAQLIKNVTQDHNYDNLPMNSLLYSGLAINNVGQFQQCKRVNYGYFLVYFENNISNINTFMGVCVPTYCKAEDIQSVASYYPSTTFSYQNNALNALTWIGLVILVIHFLIILGFSCFASFKSESQQQKLVKEKPQDQQIKKTTANNINFSINTKQEQKDENQDEDKVEYRFTNIFDGYYNYCKIFQISPKRNLLKGLKFLAIFMVIVATEFSFRQTVAQNNYKADIILKKGLGYIITNVDFAYSTLFWISGIIAAYSLYKIDSFTQMFRSLLSKLMRIWPLLVLFTLFAYGLSSVLISNPLRKIWNATNTQDCTNMIWRKWFFVNTLILDNKICLPWTWLIQTQMVLFILAPLYIIILKTRKSIGYILLFLIMIISIIFSYAIIDFKDITFYPNLIFNNRHDYVYHFQMNPLVRANNFYLGLCLGIFIINGLQKQQSEEGRTNQYKFARYVKKNIWLQFLLQFLGLTLVTISFWLIVPIENSTASASYISGFLSITPFTFLVGLSLLIIPSMFQGQAPTTRLINLLLAGNFWSPLDKMSNSIYLLGPLVIGFTTYSLQASVYYSYESIILLLIGDVALILILSLIMTSCLQLPLIELQKFLDISIFGRQNKESIVVIQQ